MVNERTLIRLLKLSIILGFTLVALGYYLISYVNLPEKMGITGIIICAVFFAFGLLLLIPAKVYLTMRWMRAEKKDNMQKTTRNKNKHTV